MPLWQGIHCHLGSLTEATMVLSLSLSDPARLSRLNPLSAILSEPITLHREEPPIPAPQPHELLMRPILHDALPSAPPTLLTHALTHESDLISHRDGRQAVGHIDRGRAPPPGRLECGSCP